MNKIIIGVIVVLLILAGGWFFISKMQPGAPALNSNDAVEKEDNKLADVKVDIVAFNQKHEVAYMNSGYSPSALTIKKGDTVVFKNQSISNVWTGSAMHPSHMVYGGKSLQEHCPDAQNDDFDECKASKPGESWEFTFNKTGAWGYHNHMNATHFGKITVEE